MAEPAPPPLLEEEGFTTAAAGLRRQESLAQALGPGRPALLLAWRAPPALILGRSDARLPGFAAAAAALAAEGWPLLVRRSGGSACPVAPGTLQLALARVAAPGQTMEAGYAELSGLLMAALARLGLAAAIGECPEAFCPGRWDLSLAGRKVAGLSQHWRRSAAGLPTVTTAASLILSADPAALAACVERFYRAAGAPRPCPAEAVGAIAPSLEGETQPQLMRALRAALAEAEFVRGDLKGPRQAVKNDSVILPTSPRSG